MKSRTSFFNKTVFRKNLTRFAPAWVLYTLCMLMGLVRIMDSGSDWMPENMVECIQIMSVITPCYAFLVAQLLFGDLYNARMCNALHAMPIRREGWFITNVASGFVFHLIPTVVMGTLATLYMAATSYPMGWVTGPLWILCVNLQFICFFGIAVFSAFCVGNRFAMAVVYGILNFGSLIAGWLVDTLYEPMLYGVKTNLEPFFWFSPVGFLVEHPVADMVVEYSEFYSHFESATLLFEEGWGYLWICVAVGIVLTALALMLYRRRRLESAGDFMALKPMEPVFLIVYTVCMGAAFQFVMSEMFGIDGMFFLFVGLAVGYFTAQMLLQRTARVFRLKAFGYCAILMAAVGASLLLVAMDPFGIETWMPEKSDVKYVVVSDGHYEYHDCEIRLEEPEDVEKVLALHQEALDGWIEEQMAAPAAEVVEVETLDAQTISKTEQMYHITVPVTLEYHLKNGRTVSRYYYIWNYTESGQNVNAWFSSAECVFGSDTDVDTLLKMHHTVYVDSYYSDGESQMDFTGEDVRTLLEAILKDCEAGTMAQDWDFHQPDNSAGWLFFTSGLELRVYTNNENVLQWMEDHGVDVEAMLEERLG